MLPARVLARSPLSVGAEEDRRVPLPVILAKRPRTSLASSCGFVTGLRHVEQAEVVGLELVLGG